MQSFASCLSLVFWDPLLGSLVDSCCCGVLSLTVSVLPPRGGLVCLVMEDVLGFSSRSSFIQLLLWGLVSPSTPGSSTMQTLLGHCGIRPRHHCHLQNFYSAPLSAAALAVLYQFCIALKMSAPNLYSARISAANLYSALLSAGPALTLALADPMRSVFRIFIAFD